MASNNNNNDNASACYSSIECSDQPLCLDFHPKLPHLLAAGLVDGTVELHDMRELNSNNNDDDSEMDTIVSSTQAISINASASQQPDANTAATANVGLEKDHDETTSTTLPPSATSSCRSLKFSANGQSIYCGGAGGELVALDANIVGTFDGNSSNSSNPFQWKLSDSNSGSALQVVTECSIASAAASPLVVTGNDEGVVQVWDARLMSSSGTSSSNAKKHSRPVQSYHVHEDFISAIQSQTSAAAKGKSDDNGNAAEDNQYLLTTSADGTLSVYDIRMAMQQSSSQQKVVAKVSDNQEDELLSLQVLKNGKKVVVGTGMGVLAIWSWGTWGDVSDRFPNAHHGGCVESMLKWDEDTLLTGSLDGLLRVVQVQPDKVLGVLRSGNRGGDNDDGGNNELPIEQLAMNANRSCVGAVSHDTKIRLYDTRILHEDYDDEGDKEDDMSGTGELSTAAPVAAAAVGNDDSKNSDDEWEDMDEELADSDDSDDDDDDDDESSKEETANDRRAKRLKTDSEMFFEDL